ncbi:MAG: PH domain-containing protein [Gemmatimonadaceae bacterium]
MPSEALSDDVGRGKRLHPLTILFSTAALARGLVLPAVVGGVSAAGGDIAGTISWIVALLAIPTVAASVGSYLYFRYTLRGDELVIRSGLVRRQHRVIPLGRVQNTEIRQSALQRLFSVVELRVETAGSAQSAEATLSVLGREEADALRAEILSRRHVLAAPASAEQPAPAPALLLLHLSTADLVLAGATANEAGIVLAAIAGAMGVLDDLPIPLPAWLENPSGLVPELSPLGTAAFIVGALAALFIVGRVFSIAGSVIGYGGFTLERAGGELRKRYGLLARREAHVPLRRVQAVRVEESVLRRKLGVASLKIETAGGYAGSGETGGAEAFVPLTTIARVPALLQEVFPGIAYPPERFHLVHPRSRRRAFTRYAAVLFVLSGTLALLFGPRWLLALAATPLLYALAAWQYRHRGYAVLPDYLVARGGALRRVTWIIPERKLQTLHVTETPFQRRHGLATIVLDSASGKSAASVVDLARDDAAALLTSLSRRAAAQASDSRYSNSLG